MTYLSQIHLMQRFPVSQASTKVSTMPDFSIVIMQAAVQLKLAEMEAC